MGSRWSIVRGFEAEVLGARTVVADVPVAVATQGLRVPVFEVVDGERVRRICWSPLEPPAPLVPPEELEPARLSEPPVLVTPALPPFASPLLPPWRAGIREHVEIAVAAGDGEARRGEGDKSDEDDEGGSRFEVMHHSAHAKLAELPRWKRKLLERMKERDLGLGRAPRGGAKRDATRNATAVSSPFPPKSFFPGR